MANTGPPLEFPRGTNLCGMTFPRTAWVPLESLPTDVGCFHSCLHKRGMTPCAACKCDAEEQTVDHVVLQCPIHRPPHGLKVRDKDTFESLLNNSPRSSAAKQWTAATHQTVMTTTLRLNLMLIAIIRIFVDEVKQWKLNLLHGDDFCNGNFDSNHGHNEIRCRPFEPEVFRKQMYCIKKSNKYMWHCWDISTPPAVIRRPGMASPSTPSLRLWLHHLESRLDGGFRRVYPLWCVTAQIAVQPDH